MTNKTVIPGVPLMRFIFLKTYFIAACIVSAMQVNAQTSSQTCTGSLGDPVINQNFGSGATPGAPLAPRITNMSYTSAKCPDDGYYTIASNLINDNSCHPGTWHDVPADHTGNPNGYMMIVNASFQPSIFFTQTANGLCPNTTYEFSAYILNLITLAASGPDVNEPNITFSIETTSGQVLTTATTGTLAATADVHWYNFGIYFTTPSNITDVIVKMTNNAPGGNGNDLILDDITFRPCGPVIQVGFASINGPALQNTCVGTPADFTVAAQATGANNPSYQWQVNDGSGWLDVSGANSYSYHVTSVFNNTGIYQYRLGVANGANISSAQCRVYSPALRVNVTPKVVAYVSSDATVCEDTPTQLNASGGSIYKWTPSTGLDHDDIPNPVATLSQTTTYSVNVSNGGCYDDSKSVTLTVRPKPTVEAGEGGKIFAGQSLKLNGMVSGNEIVKYYWTPTTYINDPTSLTPVVNPPADITYSLNVLTQNCGVLSSTVFVRVYQQITVPNTFTPNNDGINDYWNIDKLNTYPEGVITVFDRYGQQVFQSRGYTTPWDGRRNGVPVPAGTYYYIIDLNNNTRKIPGWVLIVR